MGALDAGLGRQLLLGPLAFRAKAMEVLRYSLLGIHASRGRWRGWNTYTCQSECCIRLDETDPGAGVAAEHAYLSGQFGQAGVDWTLQAQRLLRSGGRAFDVMTIEVRGQSLGVIFDITSFFGR